MLYTTMSDKLRQIQTILGNLNKEISRLPEGYLVCAKNGKYFKWYQSFGHTNRYIPKRQHFLAEKLAYKKYLELKVLDFQKEKSALEKSLSLCPQIDQATAFFTSNTEYRKLLAKYFPMETEDLQAWNNATYPTKAKKENEKLFDTLSGVSVRSKSESMISSYLFFLQIPFRYECALTLDGITLYPDFTIMHPETKKIYYWEHFGLYDQPKYRKSTMRKLDIYAKHGIIPGINLITTFETSEYSLTNLTIAKTIQYYFRTLDASVLYSNL